jgi:mannitol-1-/sugar-/sorbitol-6-phosphatase
MQAQAILFDMDGTLLNSIAVIERLWGEWAARHALSLQAILAVAHGRPTIETMRLVAPHLPHAVEAEEYTRREIAQTEGIVAIPGAMALLQALPRKRWCIVTSANRALAIARLTAVGLPISDVLITVDDIAEPKPHPEGYLKAARLLGYEPADCLVIEDAPAGLLAAQRAGMRSIAVGTTMSATELEGHPWISDLSCLRLDCSDSPLTLRVV